MIPHQSEAMGMTNLIDQTPVPQDDILSHNTSNPLDGMADTQFMDFSFPYQNLAARTSIAEQTSSGTTAVTANTTFTNTGTKAQTQSGSLDGSDGTSPESNRAGAGADGYSDEFGTLGAGDGSDLGSKTMDDKNETPAWSELKTKAGKERKRLPLACIACRRKKIRCSGEKPACKHCLRSRIPCVYKVTTRKAAPRTDYMAMLDKRLKRMEERIIKIVPKEEQDQNSVVRAQVKPAIPGTLPSRVGNGKKRAANEAFGSELDAWAKSGTKSGEAAVPGSLLAQEAEEGKLLEEGLQALPSQEIREHLAEVFFENLYGQAYHVLHKPSFMRKLKAGTVPPVLILAVCAVSARFSTHPKLNTTPAFLRGESWASEARNIVMKRYEWPNITILTCLLLLGLHEFGTCYGGRSWALGGMAIRMAYALQLHRDLDYDPCQSDGRGVRLSFIDREIRRRTMWACFLMDRFNSSSTDRPMFVKEETIKVQLPIREKFFQLDMEGPTEAMDGSVPHPVEKDSGQLSNPTDNMGVAAYIIRAIALWGRIIIYHFQGGREVDPHQVWEPESHYVQLEKQTEDFIKTLPDSLTYSTENLGTHDTEGLANQYLFLHISTQQNILFLNHIAIHGHPGGRPPKDFPRDFVTKTTGKAFEAAKRISELLRVAEAHPVTAPFAGYCAFLSSTVQMAAAFSKNPQTEALAKKNLATNVRFLTKMKRYWGAFHWTSEQLKEQFKSCADAAKQGPGEANSNQPIFQYGDWFNRYPHGVSQSDFEDPAVSIKQERGDDAVLEQKSDYHTVGEYFNTLSPSQPSDGQPVKPNKRKSKKQAAPPQTKPPQPPPPSQQADVKLPETSLPPDLTSLQQMPDHSFPQQNYNQINPSLPFAQPYYGQDLLPQQRNMVPQLDRQLVFGAYANGMDGSIPGGMLDGMGSSGWDLGMNAGLFTNEPTSAWFMPFNMEPPEINTDGDVFAGLGGMGMGYGNDMDMIGLGPVDGQGSTDGSGIGGPGGA